MSKDCEAIQQTLSLYLDGELTGHRLRDLQGHLDRCQNCQTVVQDYSRIGQLLREEVDLAVERIDLVALHEKTRERLAIRLRRTAPTSAGLRQRRKAELWVVKRARAYAWQLTWALGFGIAVAVFWFGPRVWESRDQSRFSASGGMIQEQLGRVIRDTASVRFAALQASHSHQEQLGRLIRDHSHLSRTQTSASGGSDDLATGEVQEQLGFLIRDHNRSQWIMDQQSGQLQEKLERLIQDQAVQRPKPP